MDAKLEILKITMGQLVTTIEKKNITSADRLRDTLKKKVDEAHNLKINVQENSFVAEEDKEGILECSVQIGRKNERIWESHQWHRVSD